MSFQVVADNYLKDWLNNTMTPSNFEKRKDAFGPCDKTSDGIKIRPNKHLKEEQLKSILNNICTLMDIAPIIFGSHIMTLIRLERCSRDFNVCPAEKALCLFQEHINKLKSKHGFEINKSYIRLQSPERWNAVRTTFLGIATLKRCPILVEALIKEGADVNLGMNNSGPLSGVKNGPLSPLQILVLPLSNDDHKEKVQQDQCVNLLIKNGCKIESYKDDSLPLLWLAVSNQRSNIARSLVQAKVDVNMGPLKIDKEYKNLLDLALRYKCDKDSNNLIRILMRLGAEFFPKIRPMFQSNNVELISTWFSDKDERYQIFYQGAIAHIGYVENTLLTIFIQPIMRIVTDYLDLPSPQSLTAPTVETKAFMAERNEKRQRLY